MQRHQNHQNEIDDAFDALLKTAMAEYREKQAAQQERGPGNWSYDLESCSFTLELSNQSLTYQLTPIATYIPDQSSWLWSWANDTIPQSTRDRSAKIKVLAEKTQYKIFISPQITVSLNEMDELCALALHELRAEFIFKDKRSRTWLLFALN